MPLGRSYLLASATVHCIVLVILHSLSQWIAPPYVVALLSTLFLALIVSIILTLAGHSLRVQQTLTALYASSALVNLVLLILIALSDVSGFFILLLNAVALVLICWSFAVDAFIFSRALNLNMWLGLLVAIFVFITHQATLGAWQAMV